MAGWNGSGSFSRNYRWADDAAASIPISSIKQDTELDTIVSGLNNCLTRDGQNAPSANLPMAGFKHTNVADGTARNQYATLGQLQDGGAYWCGTAGGTADALTATLTPAITAYAAGMTVAIKAASDNTSTTPTLQLNGIASPVTIQKSGGALVAGDIKAGAVAEMTYDGTNFQLLNPKKVDAADLPATYAPQSRSVASGAGLTGGGDLSADRTLAVGAGTGIVANADDVAIDKATQNDMEGQTSNKVVTADNAKWHPGMPKAWVSFRWNGSAIVVEASHNVSGVVRNSTGNYTVSFSTAFSSGTYCVQISAGSSSAPASTTALVGSRTAGACDVYGISNSGSSMADPSFVCVSFFGDQ